MWLSPLLIFPFDFYPSPMNIPSHLFLLAGQSNMAGRGKFDESAPYRTSGSLPFHLTGIGYRRLIPSITTNRIKGSGLAKPLVLNWQNRMRRLSLDSSAAACGGSPISVWQPGMYFKGTESHPYDDAIQRTKRAIEEGVLKGILWHQG